jgi:ATP-dependent DNA helicase RecG
MTPAKSNNAEKENQTIEWKQSWRDEYLKWICGFANAQGGTLVIGKNDKGEVTGLSNASILIEEIPNKIRDILGMIVPVNMYSKNGKEWLEIVIDPYPSPISYKGEYHYRSGSTKQVLKGAALDRFLLNRQGRHWDGVPVPYVAVGDLDVDAIDDFRRLAARSQRISKDVLGEPAPDLLDKLHLLDRDYLKRSTVLLFHPDPERFITNAYVKIGFFENNIDLHHQDEVHGCLFTQIHQTIDILKAKYLKALISYEGLQRIETYPVPEPALREAILNALVHKDYASAVPIQISVYPDKLMIWNPGQLPSGWTVERLFAKHASQPFNPEIANTFFRAGLIEAWGRGIERIMTACAASGLAHPELELEQTGLWVIFNFASTTTTEQTTQETTREKILAQIKNKPGITRKELALAIGISEEGIKYNLNKMKDAGILRRQGSNKSGCWEILV